MQSVYVASAVFYIPVVATSEAEAEQLANDAGAKLLPHVAGHPDFAPAWGLSHVEPAKAFLDWEAGGTGEIA